jgi:hypothetical protein
MFLRWLFVQLRIAGRFQAASGRAAVGNRPRGCGDLVGYGRGLDGGDSRRAGGGDKEGIGSGRDAALRAVTGNLQAARRLRPPALGLRALLGQGIGANRRLREATALGEGVGGGALVGPAGTGRRGCTPRAGLCAGLGDGTPGWGRGALAGAGGGAGWLER